MANIYHNQSDWTDQHCERSYITVADVHSEMHLRDTLMFSSGIRAERAACET
jgi:hypothetical protein